ncbi:MAG TPA: hypothetical protein VKB79_05135 [Bryobacteraceae bacterium]|nr:hypothetical protein [Bryobacteraceae bacterium]
MKLRLLPILLAPLALQAQNGPDMQKILDRLDQLEKQNQELLAEIHELRNELEPRAAAAPLSTPSPPEEAPLPERMAVQEARTAEMAQSKVEASQKMPVTLTGMLLFNAFMNSEYSGGFQYPLGAAANSGAATTGATLRQTILGLKFNGPELPGGGKVSGFFNMDFWGGTASASNNLFRIRTAMVDLRWGATTISVGQDKPIVSPREPVTLAQVGLSPLSDAGNLWLWQPQARIEQRVQFGGDSGLIAQAGLYQTSESYPINGAPAYASSLERARPAYQGRFEFFRGSENRRFEVAPGFSVSDSHVAGTTASSSLFTLDWLARPISKVEITGAFFHGDNAAGLGALRQGFTVLTDGTVLPVHANGAWGQIAVFAAPRLSFHFYGGEESDHSQGFTTGNISRNLTYAGNVIYKLAPNVLAAFEIAQARTNYVAQGTRLNNHYDLALGYLF